MNEHRTAMERAFELARSGACSSFKDIQRCLRMEGYAVNQIIGITLSRQLRILIAEARGEPPRPSLKALRGKGVTLKLITAGGGENPS